jgi:hypothetical protein
VKHRYGRTAVAIAIAVVVTTALYGSVAYATFNTRRLADQIRVWNFKPTAEINGHIKRDDMSAEGKFLYLASLPKIESKDAINQTCSAVTSATGILGCYVEKTKRIYLLHETDKRIDGAEDVMAAHEMLVAAWDRMSQAQRAPLLAQLKHVLATNDDPDIDLPDDMSAVRESEPKEADAELYAMVGTEVPQLDAQLEASYAQFFVQRSVITALNAHSLVYIIALRKKAEALMSTMDTLYTTIKSREKSLDAAVATLRSNISSFNARANTPGGFASEGQFNADRTALVARENSLKATNTQINDQIDTYNSDLKQVASLAKIALDLAQKLNVTLTPLQHVSTA